MRRGKGGEPANHFWAQQSSAAQAGGIASVIDVTLRAGTSCKDEREITLCTMQRGWSPRSGSGFSPFLKITAEVKRIPSPLYWDLGLIQTEARQRRHRSQQITGTSEAIAFKCPLCHEINSPLSCAWHACREDTWEMGARAPPRPLSIPVYGMCVPPRPVL